MPDTLKRLARGLLPSLFVDYIRHRRIIRKAGGSVGLGHLLQSEDIVSAAEECSLTLLPEGYGSRMNCIIDIGANEGQWSSALLRVLSPEKLIAVEPVPSTFALLKAHLPQIPNIILKNVAVGEEDGTTRFFVTRDTTGASALKPKNDEWREHVQDNWDVNKEIEVPMCRIDTIAKDCEEVSLLKLDVQGFELSAIRGATETLKRTLFVLVELNFRQQYENGSTFGEVYNLLTQEHGFYLANLARPLVFDREAAMADGLFANPRFVPRRIKR